MTEAVPMTQAIIFDVDGTLADTEDLHRQAFNEAFRRFGLPWVWDTARYCELLEVTGGKERIGAYIDGLDLREIERHRLRGLITLLHAAKTGIYAESIRGADVRPRSGVRRLMLEARAAGVRLAIASTTSHANIEPLIEAGFGSDAMRWFDTIAAGDVVARKKPAPDIYNVALRALGIAPDCAIAIEDSAIGVRSAKAAGLFTIATPNRWTEHQDFAPADLRLCSLGDPDEPLLAVDHRLIGAQYLTVERLKALHGANRGQVECRS